MGMADARCTNYVSSRLYNDGILYTQAHLNPFDESTKYREWLQESDPEAVYPEPSCSVFNYKEDYHYPR